MSKDDKNESNTRKPHIAPIAPLLGINYGSSPLLEYAYPPINEIILKNITNAIAAVPTLYNQVLHLMNKMNLPPPFGQERKRSELPLSDIISVSTKDEVKYYGDNVLKKQKDGEVEEEDEMEYSDKRMKIEQPNNPFSKTETIQNPFVQEQSEQVSKVVAVDNKDVKSMFIQPASVRTCVSRQDILKHRISKEEMSQQKVFNNYSFGEPSTKLYLRNMNKDTSESELLQLFGCFFDNDDVAKENLQVRLMEGRMKGQAFVTFPSIELAREALTTVNGYILQDKPVVICFGKQN